ncbi:hypothetical protein V6N11_018500 [Hibiscus sabdariffa]|uniref:Uncharacterized protein n=1 Tax=Hibiscus sabdariffa TaxID=183260 RepID=A0ABR2T7Y0_9ROSI
MSQELTIMAPLRGHVSSHPFSGMFGSEGMITFLMANAFQFLKSTKLDWIFLNANVVVSLLEHSRSIGGVLRGSSGDWIRGYSGLVSGYPRFQVQYDNSVSLHMILDSLPILNLHFLYFFWVKRVAPTIGNRIFEVHFYALPRILIFSLHFGI